MKKEKQVQVSATIPQEVLVWLKEKAIRERRSVSFLIAEIVKTEKEKK